MSDEKVCFAQIDGHLDTNPKIRKAGSVFATAVFEFLLRRVAVLNTNGTIPIRYIDPEYLAEMLMCTCDEARHGTSRAVTADLISIDASLGLVFIVGWSAEWGRRPKGGAERQKSYRERQKAKSAESGELQNVTVTERDGVSSRVTSSDESDVREEKRREEKEEMSGKPDVPALDRAQVLAEVGTAEINKHAGTKYRADSASTVKLCRALVRAKHTPDEVVLVVQHKRSWLTDTKMRQYFAPGTLFALANFEKYLDEIDGGCKQAQGVIRIGPAANDDDEPSFAHLGMNGGAS